MALCDGGCTGLARVLFLASEYVSKQVRVVFSRVNPSVF
jgi:hypothetical protein